MNSEEKKKIRKRITAAAIVLLVLVVAYLVYTIASGNTNAVVFNIVVGVFLLLYWLLLDVAEPKLTGDLEGLDGTRMRAFYRSILLGFAGYAGLLYFLMNIGSNSTGLLGVIVYVLTIGAKRKAREEYLGITEKAEAGSTVEGSPEEVTVDADGHIIEDEENIIEEAFGSDGGEAGAAKPEAHDIADPE